MLGYAVLAYVAQQAVEHYHWLRSGEMLDGLSIAETMPVPASIDPGALALSAAAVVAIFRFKAGTVMHFVGVV